MVVSFASFIGATLAFLAARTLLRDWVRDRLGSRAEAIDKGLRRDGTLFLVSLRLIPVILFFAVNLLMGLTAMPLRRFYLTNQLAILAGTAVYVNAGTRLARLESVSDILSPRYGFRSPFWALSPGLPAWSCICSSAAKPGPAGPARQYSTAT